MKKILIVVAIVITIIMYNKETNIIIPESSIRFRVIANSNTLEDQVNKSKLSKNLSSYIYNLIKYAKSKEDATNIINSNYHNIDDFVKNYLIMNNIHDKYDLSIGLNYFDQKNYQGIDYNAGYYDSIVLSLGEKRGVNWWCVMYPPLCLIDEDTSENEYTTLVQDMLKKYNA